MNILAFHGTPVDPIVGNSSDFPIGKKSLTETEKTDKKPHLVFGKIFLNVLP